MIASVVEGCKPMHKTHHYKAMQGKLVRSGEGNFKNPIFKLTKGS